MPKNPFSNYYRKDLKNLYSFLVPSDAEKLTVKSGQLKKGKYDYLILDDLVGNLRDVQSFLIKCRKKLNPRGKIIITYYNHLWEPFLKLASLVGLRKRLEHEQNWLNTKDIKNLLELSKYDVVTIQKRFLFPIPIPILSILVNKLVAPLPIFNPFCLTTYAIAQPVQKKEIDYSVSIVVPAKNEEKNISKIIPSIPIFGKSQEVIFVEGHSKDETWTEIQNELQRKHKKKITVKAFKQKGVGKADAVKLGFSNATGDILIVYDADRTVDAKDLVKFYDVLSSGLGEFANGSRLVYPTEKEAMRMLNKFANKGFSMLFTWILGQNFKDTLCGTKALFKKDYEKIRKMRDPNISKDPFGDFMLIFGAVKRNLKVIEIPIRYKEREYGKTNISRFKHGLLLLRMTISAYLKFKTF